MTSNEIESKRKVKGQFIALVEDDYTELWLLSELLYEKLRNPTKESVLRLAKEIIHESIEEHGIYVVDIHTELRTEMTQDQIFSLIDRIFEVTNGKPTIGDGLWFSADVS